MLFNSTGSCTFHKRNHPWLNLNLIALLFAAEVTAQHRARALHTLALRWAYKILQILSHPLQTTKKNRKYICRSDALRCRLHIRFSARAYEASRMQIYIYRERAHSDTYSLTSLAWLFRRIALYT